MPESPSEKATSVIIVTYRTGPALWVCLYRLLQLKGLHELIIVNNGNDYDVELHLRKLTVKHPFLKLISGHGNVGFAKACNMGAQAATGRYVLLLNPDAVLLEDDALHLLTEPLTHDEWQPPVGLVGGILRNEDGSEQRASRRNFITPRNALLEGIGLHRLFGAARNRINIHHDPLPSAPAPLDAVSGACMAMDRERYLLLHGLDENYFLHVEDMDFCKRVHLAGGGVWIQPRVNVLHYLSTSSVSGMLVERMKTKGFIRYFNTHYHRNYIGRAVVEAAVVLRLAAKITASFTDDFLPMPIMTDAMGLRRVQAIVRGVEATLEALRHKQPSPIPPASTVLITGASSAVGLFAIGRLLAFGHKVIALKHHTLVGFFHPNLKWLDGDLTSPEKIAQSLAGIHCDYALHCAPIWHTHGLVAALKPTGLKRIVAIGSTSVFSKPNSPSEAERATAEKLATGEALFSCEAEAAGVEWAIIRPTLVYGAGLDENITRIARIIDKRRAFTLPQQANGLRAPIHADDVALAAINALGKPEAANRCFNLQGGTILPYQRMVEAVFRAMGVAPKIRNIYKLDAICKVLHPLVPRFVPHQAVALRMQDDLIFDDASSNQVLDITPRPFLQDGIFDLGVCSEEMCRALLPA